MPATSRPTRPIASAALAGLLALAGLGLSACGSDDPAAAHHTGTTAAHHHDGPPPSTVEVTARDYSFDTSTDVVAAGPVTVRLVNEGKEGHQVQLARLADGTTPEDFTTTFERDGEGAAMDLLSWAGGVNAVEPGASATATSDVPAGEYVLLCFIPTPGKDGRSHVLMGMIGHLTAVATAAPAAEPEPGAPVTLADFSITLPPGFAGGPVTIRNEGQQPHELILFQFAPGKGIPDLMAWQAAGMPAERPFTYVGGTGTIEPGASITTTIAEEPGDYLALCVVSGEDIRPHLEMGMVTPFTVTA